MPNTARVRSTASTIFFLPSLDRCERPVAASLRASGVHPGRLAQGPDEKSAHAGREFGFNISFSLTEELHSGGGAWPTADIGALEAAVNVPIWAPIYASARSSGLQRDRSARASPRSCHAARRGSPVRGWPPTGRPVAP